MTLAVIYLARLERLPSGLALAPIEAFFRAYEVNPAGIPHEFVVAIKGDTGDIDARARVVAQTALRGGRVLSLPDVGFDLGSYRRAALELDHEHVCFLNTRSRPRAPGWLANLFAPHEDPAVGLTGATGSLEVHPHLRTNAFLLRRMLYLELMQRDPFSREECWWFEHGPDNMTRALERRGQRTFMVGRLGPVPVSEGMHQRIFRSGEQEDLLVADNRTDAYEFGSAAQRDVLRRLAWGVRSTGVSR